MHIFIILVIILILLYFFLKIIPYVVTVILYGSVGAAALMISIYIIRVIIKNVPTKEQRIKNATFNKFDQFKKSGEVAGNPEITQYHWDWQRGNTCAIEAQSLLLKVFGIARETDDLSKRQQAFGMYSPEAGSSSIKVLLNGYGVCTNEIIISNSELDFVVWESLSNGKFIIATTNSHLLNNPDKKFRSKLKSVSDHAIVIIGVQSIKGEVFIYYSDSGVFDGSLKAISSIELKKVISDEIIETQDNYNIEMKRKQFDPFNFRKTICCPGCRQKLAIPFGRKLNVRCKKCSAEFQVNDKFVSSEQENFADAYDYQY